MYRISFESIRDIGKKRSANEDFVLVEPSLRLFCVADGVGGEAAGEVASRLACETVVARIRAEAPRLAEHERAGTPESRLQIQAILQGAVESACARVFTEAHAQSKLRGMSTTLEVVLLQANHVFVAHVGDSRTYLIRGGRAHLLTEDHKVGVQMVKQGVWTVEQAQRSPLANTLTRSIGGQEFVEVDTIQVELMPNDAFLSCTDGLYEGLDDARVAQIVSSQAAPKAALQALQTHAYERGAKDNLSGVLFQCVAEATSPGIITAATKLDTLKHIHLFRYLTYPELNQVLGMTRPLKLAPQTRLIEEGAQGKELFVLVQGSVSVRKGGREVAVLKRGQIVGEMSLIDQAPRSASVVVRETAEVLAISRESFVAFMRKEPQIAVKVLWALAVELNQNLRQTTEKLVKATSV